MDSEGRQAEEARPKSSGRTGVTLLRKDPGRVRRRYRYKRGERLQFCCDLCGLEREAGEPNLHFGILALLRADPVDGRLLEAILDHVGGELNSTLDPLEPLGQFSSIGQIDAVRGIVGRAQVVDAVEPRYRYG